MELDDLTKGLRAEQVQSAPLLEKIVALVGVIIVVAVLGILGYEASRREDAVPEIILTKADVKALSEGYWVKILAENKGTSATADLVIEGTVGEGDEKQTSTVTFDYVPAHSKREGGLYFSQNPESLKLRALGYQKP
ncbi:MAG: hypothetical protein V4655_09595 [Bdellovibrionota bacterium]